MSNEELLQPRYKLIADYPNNKDFVLDKIIEMNGQMAKGYPQYEVEDCQGKRQYLFTFFELYPHLFKKLEWQEERNVEEMPKYIKYLSNGKVYEAIKYLERNSIVLLMDDYWKIEIKNQLGEPFWMPSTEDEYNAYCQTK